LKLTPIILAAELGYAVTGVKSGGSEAAVYTLEKGDRKVVLDQAIIDDIAGKVMPVENPDANSCIQAVS